MRQVALPFVRLRALALVCVVLLAVCAPSVARPSAAYAQANPPAVAAVPGLYSPNTTITVRDGQFWFVRPPFESQLVPTGDGSYLFASGWVQGYAIRFVPNDSGGTSILLRDNIGNWNEFARSGEIYPDLDPALRGELARVLDQIAARSGVPGVALYVNIPGQGMWAGARGVAEQGQGIPLVPLDRFRIASVTKTFVATVVMQLVQEGHLSLDDSVERVLPGLLPTGNSITVRQLLNHTSGLPNYLSNGFMNRVFANPNRTWSPPELVGEVRSRPLAFAPGTQWSYSNTNYIVLGLIVERLTGNPLDVVVRQRIIEPLGLWRTEFAPNVRFTPDLARGYVGRRDSTDLNMSFAWAAGGMISTTEDMGRFVQALFGGQLLREDILAQMLTFVDNPRYSDPFIGYGEGVMRDHLSVDPGFDPALGVAWGHTGGLTGYRTAMWYLPQSGITIAVAVNQMSVDPNSIATPALNAVLRYQAGRP